MRARRAGESALLLLDVVDVLRDRHTAYAVVGALAASVHGAVRASLDADLIVSMALRDAAQLEPIFEATGLKTQLTRGGDDDPIPGMLQLTDAHGNRVDMLIGLRGLEPAAFARAIDVPFQGATLKFIGREDFIAMKVYAGGPLDLIDAARALHGAGDSLDAALLRRLAQRYGRGAVAALTRLLASHTPSQP